MKEELIRKLGQISEEEKLILSGKAIDKSIYTAQSSFNVDSKNMLSIGKYITVRTHTRFADFPLHSHNFVEIMYVCSGNITHIIDEKEIVMSAGDILFMNQYVLHSIKKANENDIGVNFIILPEFFDIPLVMMKKEGKNPLADFLIGTFKSNSPKARYLHFKTNGNFEIENLMENIIGSLALKENADENINQFTMGLVFLHLLNNIDAISENSLQAGSDILTDAAIEYINNRYKDASLSALAKSMHRTAANMSKLIKKNTGHTFSELLTKKRFSQAVVFLAETDMPVSDIINAVGYENSSYFYKTFRAKYKMSPKDYRKTCKEDENKKMRI